MAEDALRTELTEIRETVHAGFARMDRYFELQQGQHLELRSEVQGLRALLIGLTTRVDRIEARLDALEAEVRSLRDWVSRELADVRRELRLLREAGERDAELRRDADALEERVTRLEQRHDDRLA